MPFLFLLALAPFLVQSRSPAAAPDSRATWFVFLETGRPTPPDKEAVATMQRGHLANFGKLFAEKKLFAAGPLADPSKKKRGIVVVKADSKEELTTYFEPDQYVRDGYMTLNAEKAAVHKPLASEGIDPNGIEEVRIVMISRGAKAPSEVEMRGDAAFLQALVDKGTFGAWYSMKTGDIAEILFARATDTAALQAALAELPSITSGRATVAIWPQYIGKGVVK
jgi:uncharacterized protein YciI